MQENGKSMGNFQGRTDYKKFMVHIQSRLYERVNSVCRTVSKCLSSHSASKNVAERTQKMGGQKED